MAQLLLLLRSCPATAQLVASDGATAGATTERAELRVHAQLGVPGSQSGTWPGRIGPTAKDKKWRKGSNSTKLWPVSDPMGALMRRFGQEPLFRLLELIGEAGRIDVLISVRHLARFLGPKFSRDR